MNSPPESRSAPAGCFAHSAPGRPDAPRPDAARPAVAVYIHTSARRCGASAATIGTTLSSAERARAATMQCGARRASYLSGRALLRHSLSRHAEVAPARWRFAAAPTGELRVVAPAAYCHLRVSISHAQGAVACAIGQHARLGLDIEPRRRPIHRLDRLVGRFSLAERRALLALPICRRRQLFLRLWTLKEAFSKALGLGLALPLDAARFHLSRYICAELAEAGEPADAWRFAQFCWSSRHWVAIAQATPAAQGAGWLGLAHLPAFPRTRTEAARFVCL